MNKTVYLLALGIFGLVMTEFSVIGILPEVAVHFQVPIEKAGWLLSVFALVVAITAPFSTLLTARINRKTMLVSALLVFTLSNILAALSPDFITMLISRILPALLHPIFWAVATALAASSVDRKQSPRAVSIVYAGLSVATVIGVPAASWLAHRFGWEAAFYANAIVNALSMLCMMIWMPDKPVDGARQQAQLALLRVPQQWVNLLIALIIIAGLFSTYGYFAQYVQQISHMSGAETSLMLFIFGLTGLAGNYVMGIMLTRSVEGTARVSFLALIAVHIALYFWAGHYVFMFILVAVWGFVHTGNFLLGGVFSMKDAGNATEFATSLFASFANLGVFTGTLLGGAVIASNGVRDTVWVSVLFLTLALAGTWVKVGRSSERT
ncbi:MFS transporter [Pantoea ananatis]|uniref:MFS transporter n=1 Tax=Pantoea ananas TaxID=553 RepID=UPI0024ADDDB7|nr:MFS transporter [Pantoea ananatis]MDI6539919.1 MFS transporter [Pantoea ananatis]